MRTDQRLVLAGDSSFTQGYAGELAAQAQQDPRVVLAGFTVGADLATLYDASTAVVQPSSLEGLPLTLLEAVGHDCAVVASDIAPHLEVLARGTHRHLLFPVDDEAALAAALERVLEPAAAVGSPESAALRADVLHRYSWDDAVDRLEDVYRAHVRTRPARPVSEDVERARHGASTRGRAVVRTVRRAARAVDGRAHPLPHFLVLGAQRSGTTSLFSDLASHPKVRVPLAKELHYFTLHERRPLEWYRRCFPLLADDEQTFEATPYYLFHPHVPQRVARTLPTARFVVILRDPVERAISHFLHTRRTGHEPLDLAAALDAEPARLDRVAADGWRGAVAHDVARQHSYLARSRYGEQLERWFEHVPRERVHVLRTEDLAARPEQELAAVTDFLGLHPWTPGAFAHHTRRPAGTRSPDLATAGVRERIREELAPDTERLRELLGWDTAW